MKIKKLIKCMLAISIFLIIFSNPFIVLKNKAEALSVSCESEVSGLDFLSDEVADKFVKLFYSQGTSVQDSVKDIITGKKKGTIDELKDIYEKSVSFFELLDSDAVEAVVSKGAAVAVDNISDLTRIISGVIDIYDNGKSFAESTNAMQKTVDGLQIFSSVMDVLGYTSYLPTGMSIVLSSTEFALSLGGYLEAAYFKENATLYQYELEIAYQTGDEIPYRKAPTITIGSSITQSEADSIYAQLYIEYCVKRMLDNVGGGVATTYEDMYAWPYDGEITLLDKSVSVDSVRFICDEYTLFMNQSAKISARTFPKNAYCGYGISSYHSSNSSVIAVNSSDGTITPVNPGIAYLYAVSNNGIEGKCKITVLPYSVSKINNTYIIDKYYGDSGVVKIPGVIEGVEVVSLGENCFYNCKNLKKVIIPSSVKIIDENAFCGCNSLTDVIIPDSVESIGYGAFSHCTSLSNITIPNSVTNIADYAFYKCSNLLNITIPDSVINIGCKAFFYCNNLISATLGNGVTDIGEFAFSRCESLSNLSLGNNVKNIGESAFSSCIRLKNIIIPDSVKSIGDAAFSRTGITSVKITNGITTINDGVFSFCMSLETVSIPNSVKSIGARAFVSCINLTEIIIPDSVTFLGKNAFSDCDSLKKIKLPNGITNISDGLFSNCDALDNVTIPDGVTIIGKNSFQYCRSLANILIPDRITSIGESAFGACDSLVTIKIPANVTNIGDWAFNNCANCKEIYVEKDNPNYSSYNGVLFDKNQEKLICCPSGKEGASYTVPSSVTEICSGAFCGCSGLTGTIEVPKSVTYIGSGAFYGTKPAKMILPFIGGDRGGETFDNNTYNNQMCYLFSSSSDALVTLKEIEITDETVVAPYAFLSCNNLTKIKLNEGITKICDKVFYGGNNIADINIPSSVKSIGSSAFSSCTKLKDIYYPKSIEAWKNILIESDNTSINNATIHCIGDINVDGRVDIKDATILQIYFAKINELSDRQLYISDTNGDGSIDVQDATQIQKYTVRLVASLG